MEVMESYAELQFSRVLEPPMAHVSICIGHDIFLIGGYRIYYENNQRNITKFDKNYFLYYNIISSELDTIFCDYDYESIKDYPIEFFCTSGMAATSVNNRIYLFGGYSLTKQESCNALYFIDISKDVADLNNIDFRRQLNTSPSALLQFLGGSYDGQPVEVHADYPSYRDKSSLVYWANQIIVFGGFGSNFYGDENADEDSEWNFLNHNGIYVPGTDSRGWNNQVLVFNLRTKKWTNPIVKGNVPCPRAAHCSSISGHRMLIFGGRLGLRDPYATIRTNNCYYLDLKFMEWTKVQLFNYSPTTEMVGRSWSTMTALSDKEFFIVGGFSGNNEPLGDAFVIRLDFENNEGDIIEKTECMNHAFWDPYMNNTYWDREQHFDPLPRMWHATTLANDGRIYIFGGCRNNLILEIERIQCVVESGRVMPPKLYNLAKWAVFKRYYNRYTRKIVKETPVMERKRYLCRIRKRNLPDKIFYDLKELCL